MSRQIDCRPAGVLTGTANCGELSRHRAGFEDVAGSKARSIFPELAISFLHLRNRARVKTRAEWFSEPGPGHNQEQCDAANGHRDTSEKS